MVPLGCHVIPFSSYPLARAWRRGYVGAQEDIAWAALRAIAEPIGRAFAELASMATEMARKIAEGMARVARAATPIMLAAREAQP
jgi:hypothetical protein